MKRTRSVGRHGTLCREEKQICDLGGDLTIALAGNPNVGKSTLFNALTGMNQHTGNWAGKTVSHAAGICKTAAHKYALVDLPGTYSLYAKSKEEEVARNFICFGSADATVVVCNATCLERGLGLVLQTLEVTPHTIVCVNMMDEAREKGIKVDLQGLSKRLGVPVIGTAARKKKSLHALTDALDALQSAQCLPSPPPVSYCDAIERAIGVLAPPYRPMPRACPRVFLRCACLKRTPRCCMRSTYGAKQICLQMTESRKR